MEKKFVAAWEKARQEAAALGVRIRPVTPEESVAAAKRCLSGHRVSDGFDHLAQLGRLDLSLEALAVKKPYTDLFDDDQANEALMRLVDAGYSFSKK